MSTLGKKVRCRVTGFEGRVTRRTEVLYGSAQVLVSGHDNGFRRDEWLEEGQIEVIGEQSLSVVSPTLPDAWRAPSPSHSEQTDPQEQKQ